VHAAGCAAARKCLRFLVIIIIIITSNACVTLHRSGLVSLDYDTELGQKIKKELKPKKWLSKIDKWP